MRISIENIGAEQSCLPKFIIELKHGRRKVHERIHVILADQLGPMANFSAFIASKSFDL